MYMCMRWRAFINTPGYSFPSPENFAFTFCDLSNRAGGCTVSPSLRHRHRPNPSSISTSFLPATSVKSTSTCFAVKRTGGGVGLCLAAAHLRAFLRSWTSRGVGGLPLKSGFTLTGQPVLETEEVGIAMSGLSLIVVLVGFVKIWENRLRPIFSNV